MPFTPATQLLTEPGRRLARQAIQKSQTAIQSGTVHRQFDTEWQTSVGRPVIVSGANATL